MGYNVNVILNIVIRWLDIDIKIIVDLYILYLILVELL